MQVSASYGAFVIRPFKRLPLASLFIGLSNLQSVITRAVTAFKDGVLITSVVLDLSLTLKP